MSAKPKNESPLTPTSSAASTSTSTSYSDATQEVLNISFPRCSCCKTSWFDTLGLGGDNNFAATQKLATVAAGKRKRQNDRPSHHSLLPMPKCECITRLAFPSLPSAFDKTDFCDPIDVLKQIRTCSFPNLAICKSCLKNRIAASKEVTVHDYHQGHIPNGQRDIRFTVELCCVQCKRKFSVRFLEKLLESNGAATSNTIEVKKNKQCGKQDITWQDAVEATIKLVGWAKRGIRKEKRRISQRRIGLVDGNEQDLRRWDNLTGFTGGDGNCSSDECYSFSSDSSYDDGELSQKKYHRQELQPGELMAELLQKDPKFRQEKDDEQYVKKILEEQVLRAAKVDALNIQAMKDEIFARQLIEQEIEAKRKATEESVRQDHEFAMKMQQKVDKRTFTSEPASTRSKSPILDSWKKSLTTADMSVSKKPRTPVSVEQIPLISTSSAEDSLGVASRNFQSHQYPKNINPKRATVELSDERATPQLSDKLVDEIVAMGFSKSSAQRSLRLADGNLQRALDLLLSEAADPS